MSTLFGKKPQFVERSAGEARLLESAKSDLARADSFRPLTKAYLNDIGDTTRETAKARGTANADVMQATSGALPVDVQRPGLSPTTRALTRANALARMGWAGAQSAQDDSFRAKMAASQFGKAVKSGSNAANETLSAGQYANEATTNYLEATRGAMMSNVLGTLAGAGASAYGGYRDSKKPKAGWYQGMSYADLHPEQ